MAPETPAERDESRIRAALPWVHAAGNPYFDWLFGDPDTARAALTRWLRRPDSEVSVTRVQSVSHGSTPVGGYIALTASELRAARRADALAYLAEAPSSQRRELLAKLRQADGLFTEPSDSDLYLSKMGVLAEHRGRGHGRRLVAAFVEQAAARGIPGLRLDVSADNDAAMSLYRSAGFTALEGEERSRAGLTYVPMVRPTVP